MSAGDPDIKVDAYVVAVGWRVGLIHRGASSDACVSVSLLQGWGDKHEKDLSGECVHLIVES